MDLDFYREIERTDGLAGVQQKAEARGELVSVCSWCKRIYATCDSSGAEGGLSHGMCTTRLAGFDCEQVRVKDFDDLLDRIWGDTFEEGSK